MTFLLACSWGGILGETSSSALQPDAEVAEDSGLDCQEDDPMDLPAVDADWIRRAIDKLRRPNGAFRLVSMPPWSNRPPSV